MSATCNFNIEFAYPFEFESQDQLDGKQRRASERAKSLSRKRQLFERSRVPHSMPPKRGAPHRAARSATRTSLAGGTLESGADITVISVPDRQNLQRKKQLKKASVVQTLKPSLWPLQKPTQQAYTAPKTSFSPSASAEPRPTFWPSAEALSTFVDFIEEDELDTCVEEQLHFSEREDEQPNTFEEQLDFSECVDEQPNTLEQQELGAEAAKACQASAEEMSDKEACFSDRQRLLAQLMDKLCVQNGGLQQQQVAAAQIQELFIDLESELQALQKESKVSNNTIACSKPTQEKHPVTASREWPKLEEGTFNLVGRFMEKAEVRLGSTTVGINEHIEAFKLSTSNNPLQQQSDKVVQKLCEALGPVWQGAECLAKDAQSELAKTAAVVAGRPPSFKTWLEDPFASVSKKLEAASHKFEADASRFMDRMEALKTSSTPRWP